ncbi:MAG: bi-domain-containing oxidoreductase [Rhizobacter sp.]|nr:bi-domain-containing oxidoreductase [Chlorobiales bacterium]
MQQLVQNARTGSIKIKSVPTPTLKRGMVLVRNRFSLISAGTERTKVETGKKSLLGKALARPDQVQLVLKQMRETGVLPTLERAFNKLNTDSAMGYASAGIVVEVADDVSEFRVGDKVACAGAGYASHAEFVVVPKNLCAKVPEGVRLEDAAYSTLGAIAMQGLRQAAPTLGETVMVIGLGLLGLLLVQELKANGCKVIGIDINPQSLVLALELGCDLALSRNDDSLTNQIQSLTHGFGVDAVIITASTSQNDPVEFAAQVMRDRGRVVMVGVTGMDLPRTPYYMKELDFRLSRSYGAGRYDANYEERGIDYPIGYVRWTEKRNMESFLQLVAEKKVRLDKITTHTFPIERGDEAYKLVGGEVKERYIGILLDYGAFGGQTEVAEKLNGAHRNGNALNIAGKTSAEAAKRIGFIGAGSFAQGYLVPHLKTIAGVELAAVCNATGINAENAKEKFGFERAVSNIDDVLNDARIGTVFIATRHDLHAELVIKALAAGKNVFVEKPLALNEESLLRLAETYERTDAEVLTGFNRRFSAPVIALCEAFQGIDEPLSVSYRVNAGPLPADHWTQDLDEGGGRLIGEGCHFIDTMQFITGSEPVRVYAELLPAAARENLVITIRFANGSVGTLHYLCNGDKLYPKERIEVFGGRRIAVMENFKTLMISEQGKERIKTFDGTKGHKEEIDAFIASLGMGKPALSFQSQVLTTLATFRINQSLNSGMPETI